MNGRSVFEVLCELATGRPRLTVRSMAAEFGPPPGAVYEQELSRYSDAELLAFGEEIIAVAREERHWRRDPELTQLLRGEADRGSDRVAAGPNPEHSSSHSRRRRTTVARAR